MPPDELNLDEDGNKTSPKKLLLLIILAVLLIGASIAGTLFYTGALDEDKEKDTKEEGLAETSQAFYLPLTPEFIVNFSGEQPANYMQIEIALMSRYQHYIDVTTQNMPRIRHEILLLLSSQKYSELRSKDGKEKLRQEILNKVREIVVSPNPSAPSIEAVYFTNFIMQ